MNSYLSLVLVACFVAAISADGCINNDSFKKYKKATMQRLIDKCKQDIRDDEDPVICAKERTKAAAEQCKKENPDMVKKEILICAAEQLGLQPKKPTFDQFKAQMLEKMNDDKKEEVGKTLDSCKDEENFIQCGWKALADGPCPDVKKFKKKTRR